MGRAVTHWELPLLLIFLNVSPYLYHIDKCIIMTISVWCSLIILYFLYFGAIGWWFSYYSAQESTWTAFNTIVSLVVGWKLFVLGSSWLQRAFMSVPQDTGGCWYNMETSSLNYCYMESFIVLHMLFKMILWPERGIIVSFSGASLFFLMILEFYIIHFTSCSLYTSCISWLLDPVVWSLLVLHYINWL